MSFGPGALNASAVYVGTLPATAVYLGTEKVWPIFVGQLSPWYSPTDSTGTFIDVAWPDGANFCDAIGISGGAGGDGTGVGGNPQIGGGAGKWGGVTYSRTQGGVTHDKIQISRNYETTSDGTGGGTIGTAGENGSEIIICPKRGAVITGALQFRISGGVRKGSTTGNRNGGNVAPTFTFNGRTYTLASYGAGAGQGGASSNKNGSGGARPGGGGQGGASGGLTGNAAGNGAHGACILYWY